MNGTDVTRATGTTDRDGRVTLTTEDLGPARLVAVSPLIGGRAEIAITFNGGPLDQSFWSPMSPDARPGTSRA